MKKIIKGKLIIAIMLMGYMSPSLMAQQPTQPIQDEEPDIEAMQHELDELRRQEDELKEKANQQVIGLPEYEERHNRLYGRLMELILRANRGNFLFEGEVVDENGQRLEGVELIITKERKTGIESESVRTDRRAINGQFSVTAQGYTAVGLIFSKSGYYQARMRFPQLTFEERVALASEFDKGRIIPRRYEHRDLRVEMHSIGELARTLSLGYQPRFSTRSDGKFLELRSFKTIPPPTGGYFLPPQRIQLGVDEIPDSAIYIKPALDQSGRILPLDEDLRYSRFPSEVTLLLNTEEGGFILHEGGAPEKGFWFMDEAPEEGYQRELKIDGQFLYERLKMQGSFSGVFFYFKVGDIYGKATLNSIGIIDGGNTLRSNIQMYFQPDGTRFLRTGRGL